MVAPQHLFQAVVLIWSATAAAADAVPIRPLDLGDQGAPSFTAYTARDGVPDEVIGVTETDAQGFFWLGSASTLARFDGHRWQTVTPFGARSLVRDLHLDRNGILWAAFDANGVARYDGKRWQLEGRASGLPTDHMYRIIETTDAQGQAQMWMTTADAGVLRRVGQHWVADPGNAELPSEPIITLAQTRQLYGERRLWAATYNSGLWYRTDGGRWQMVQLPGFDVAQVSDLLVTEEHGQEALWVVVFGGGLWRLRADGMRSWRATRGELPSDLVYSAQSMTLDNGEQLLWVASRAGLVRVRGDATAVYDRRHGLPADAVRGLQVRRSPDGAQILMVATEAGIARAVVNASPWQTISLMGARASGVFGVLLEPDGQGGERLWVASTQDGLGLLQGGRWRYFTPENSALPSPNMRTVVRATDADGVSTLFVGAAGGELLRVDEQLQFQRMDTPWAKRSGEAVMHVLARVDGGAHELWFATRRQGIFRLRAGRWTAFPAPGGIEPWLVVRMQEQIDRHGRSWLWASTNQGLARFNGSAWTLIGKAQGLPDTDLVSMSLLPEPDGKPLLWIGSARVGVIRVDISDPEHPHVRAASDLPPPPDPTVYSAQRDSQGRVYLCTNNGVQLLTPRPQGGFDERVFHRRDGLVHDECNTNAQMIDSHDRYWLGMLGGLSVYDPAAQTPRQKAVAKPLLMTEVRIDGQPVSPVAIRLAPGARELRVSYALLAWQREDETRYRTQLLGYDQAPGAWTAQNSWSLAGLVPGNYVLRVEGRDYAGAHAIPLELAVEVLPAWWQRRWVVWLGASGLLALIYAGLAWRVRRLRAQRERLLLVVNERTAELNAANRRLTQLSYLDALTGLANRRRFIEALQEAWTAALRQGTSLGLIIADVDHFKNYNDRHGHLAGDSALHAVAEAMRNQAGAGTLVARYGGEEFACLIENVDIEAACALAERIRSAVAAMAPTVEAADPLRITLSAGVAAGVPVAGQRAEDLLRAADNALYEAKNEGRNSVRRAHHR